MSKKNIGAALALYPSPVIVVGAMVNANVKHFFTPLGKDFFPCTVSSFLHRSVR